MANPDALIVQLRTVVEKPDAFKEQRQEIMELTRKAALALEDPFEIFQRLVYSPLPLITVRVAQEHNVFKSLVEAKDGISTADLSSKTTLRPAVLEALLVYMGTQSMVQETSPGQYAATPLSYILLAPLFQDGVIHFHDSCLPAFNALNQFLSNPAEPRSPFEIGQNSSVDFYTWMDSHPIQAGAFQRFMKAQFSNLPTWLSVVSFGTEFAAASKPETPLFVDVGGGIGQQCVLLREKLPDVMGKIVLQDRPDVLKNAIVKDGVDVMPYDYLTEQPVKGARAYYFRQIFHNNDDETCHRILKSHLPAMTSSSVILIDDKVLPDEKAPGFSAEYPSALSLAMLVMFKALERRESQWRKLLADAGFKIRSIRKYTDFGDSIIVAVKQ